MNKVIFFKAILSLILISVFLYLFLNVTEAEPSKTINQIYYRAKGKKDYQVGDRVYKLYEARSDSEKILGLSVFDQISENEGMFFIFDQPNYYSMYMKDMKFNIDIIFLDKNMEVVTIHENVSKDSFKSNEEYEVFKSFSPAKYVIELKEGETQKNKIKIGDQVIKLSSD